MSTRSTRNSKGTAKRNASPKATPKVITQTDNNSTHDTEGEQGYNTDASSATPTANSTNVTREVDNATKRQKTHNEVNNNVIMMEQTTSAAKPTDKHAQQLNTNQTENLDASIHSPSNGNCSSPAAPDDQNKDTKQMTNLPKKGKQTLPNTNQDTRIITQIYQKETFGIKIENWISRIIPTDNTHPEYTKRISKGYKLTGILVNAQLDIVKSCSICGDPTHEYKDCHNRQDPSKQPQAVTIKRNIPKKPTLDAEIYQQFKSIISINKGKRIIKLDDQP
ncbi:hypothetical protein RCL_jg21181.t1 [Rhizophagus clarus]|uniref:Uncharacterized protein n=1 Tax=Rhizophagus clarus TaxID=94130 RepID=A0A8H3QUS1_9GLOM|nr:hypothetical protein RCL_jg21181.t1 [Rhizophagus clarus]